MRAHGIETKSGPKIETKSTSPNSIYLSTDEQILLILCSMVCNGLDQKSTHGGTEMRAWADIIYKEFIKPLQERLKQISDPDIIALLREYLNSGNIIGFLEMAAQDLPQILGFLTSFRDQPGRYSELFSSPSHKYFHIKKNIKQTIDENQEFYIAIRDKNISQIKSILKDEKNSDLRTYQDSDGLHPFWLAAKCGEPEMVEAFIESGLTENFKNIQLYNALLYDTNSATDAHYIPSLACVSRADTVSEIEMAFMIAAQNGNMKVVQLLLRNYGISTDSDEYKIATILAVDSGHMELAEFLIDSFKSTTELNLAKRKERLGTLQWIAMKKNHPTLVKKFYDKYEARLTVEQLNKKLDTGNNRWFLKGCCIDFVECLLIAGFSIKDLGTPEVGLPSLLCDYFVQAITNPRRDQILEVLKTAIPTWTERKFYIQLLFYSLALPYQAHTTAVVDWLLNTGILSGVLRGEASNIQAVLTQLATLSLEMRSMVVERLMGDYGLSLGDPQVLARMFIPELSDLEKQNPQRVAEYTAACAEKIKYFESLRIPFYEKQYRILENRSSPLNRVKGKLLDKVGEDISKLIFHKVDTSTKQEKEKAKTETSPEQKKEKTKKKELPFLHISQAEKDILEQNEALISVIEKFIPEYKQDNQLFLVVNKFIHLYKPKDDLVALINTYVSDKKPNIFTKYVLNTDNYELSVKFQRIILALTSTSHSAIREATLQFCKDNKEQLKLCGEFKEKVIDRILELTSHSEDHKLALRLQQELLALKSKSPIALREAVLNFCEANSQYGAKCKTFKEEVVDEILKKTSHYEDYNMVQVLRQRISCLIILNPITIREIVLKFSKQYAEKLARYPALKTSVIDPILNATVRYATSKNSVKVINVKGKPTTVYRPFLEELTEMLQVKPLESKPSLMDPPDFKKETKAPSSKPDTKLDQIDPPDSKRETQAPSSKPDASKLEQEEIDAIMRSFETLETEQASSPKVLDEKTVSKQIVSTQEDNHLIFDSREAIKYVSLFNDLGGMPEWTVNDLNIPSCSFTTSEQRQHFKIILEVIYGEALDFRENSTNSISSSTTATTFILSAVPKQSPEKGLSNKSAFFQPADDSVGQSTKLSFGPYSSASL